MDPNIHGTVGALTTYATYKLTGDIAIAFTLGNFLAFAFHYPTDFLGENNGGNIETTAIFNSYGFFIFILCTYHNPLFLLLLSGYASGNIMDFIDKKCYLAIIKPIKYKFTYYFHDKKQVKWQLTSNQTIAVAFMANILALLWL